MSTSITSHLICPRCQKKTIAERSPFFGSSYLYCTSSGLFSSCGWDSRSSKEAPKPMCCPDCGEALKEGSSFFGGKYMYCTKSGFLGLFACGWDSRKEEANKKAKATQAKEAARKRQRQAAIDADRAWQRQRAQQDSAYEAMRYQESQRAAQQLHDRGW